MMRVVIDAPASSIGAILIAATRLNGVVQQQSQRADLLVIETLLFVARVQELMRQLPSSPAGWRP